jgi:hypothetical protein
MNRKKHERVSEAVKRNRFLLQFHFDSQLKYFVFEKKSAKSFICWKKKTIHYN